MEAENETAAALEGSSGAASEPAILLMPDAFNVSSASIRALQTPNRAAMSPPFRTW
jgi:hypothetical protein